MGALTAGELMQYINENDIGLTEDDFLLVDIEDFINSRGWTQDDFRFYNIGAALVAYKQRKRIMQLTEAMAREVKRVDSTDEEYDSFLQTYFKEVGKEYRLTGSAGGLDMYSIVSDDIRYFLYFGKTKNMDSYNVRVEEKDGICRICLPVSGMILEKPFCYSHDDKFFIFVETGKNDDFSHWLSETFVRIR